MVIGNIDKQATAKLQQREKRKMITSKKSSKQMSLPVNNQNSDAIFENDDTEMYQLVKEIEMKMKTQASVTHQVKTMQQKYKTDTSIQNCAKQ